MVVRGPKNEPCRVAEASFDVLAPELGVLILRQQNGERDHHGRERYRNEERHVVEESVRQLRDGE
ncbi:hypothetical protein ACFQL4_16895 [Halosimplex aquaticum]